MHVYTWLYMTKDFFAILGITPLATPDEIRRSYRRLAKEWHPDRQGSDAVATARFREVREAYETLTDPVRKDAWLQQRWQMRSMGLQPEGKAVTLPSDLLKACISLEQEVAMKDPHRSDPNNLLQRMRCLLTDDAAVLLCQEPDPSIREGVVRRLLRCGRSFDPEAAGALHSLLGPITAIDAGLAGEAERYLSTSRRRHRLERLRLPLLLIATILACLLIAMA